MLHRFFLILGVQSFKTLCCPSLCHLSFDQFLEIYYKMHSRVNSGIKEGKGGVAKPDPELLNCVVSLDSQTGALFTHESGRSFRVSDGFPAVYKGNKTTVTVLGNGSKATITLDSKQRPSRIEITYMCERNLSNSRDQEEKIRKFNKATAELRKNTELEQEFITSLDWAIASLKRFKSSKLQWLKTAKERFSATVEAAIKEAQTCLAEGSTSTNLLADALWVLSPE